MQKRRNVGKPERLTNPAGNCKCERVKNMVLWRRMKPNRQPHSPFRLRCQGGGFLLCQISEETRISRTAKLKGNIFEIFVPSPAIQQMKGEP
jgi:hypothetical protein